MAIYPVSRMCLFMVFKLNGNETICDSEWTDAADCSL